MFKLCPYTSTEEDVIATLDAIQTQLSGFLGLIATDVSCSGLKLMELPTELLIANHIRPYNFVPYKLLFGLISSSLLNCLYPYLLEESRKHKKSWYLAKQLDGVNLSTQSNVR
jgi:hypothetical protein